MIIIPPSSASAHAAGGKFDATTKAALNANFPCVSHWFPCIEAASAGVSSIADRAGSVVLPVPSITLSADGFALDPGTLTAVAPTTGTFIQPGTKATILAMVGKNGSAVGIAIGAISSGARLSVIGSTTASGLHDGTTLISGEANTIGTALGLSGIIANPAGNVRAFQIVNSTGVMTIRTGTDDTLENVTTLPNTFTISNGVTDIYGILYARFTALPSDLFLASVFQWLSANWIAGRKWMCPLLKGLS